ncbi:universal stress protein [Actinacidiphila bryophytorum]|uniref:Universal stress protein n=1 Tax=Actinacidiphila bryophytorum TaxID=1436133 RepID=A0A9W4MBF2_9ACTN|nr:universal stress protein [Actinacidiphila bryophytorum]MBM9437042.1 universal stress protein [Actinacidiphila bryophytorum]MBN6541724.1 universal stress protein [Actinacidiphila bryophytorum]CAG7646373.1 Universal stress protein [Actinacidiphila bryophytorum]
MLNSLIVGIDGSEPSLRAVDWAVAEAAHHGLVLHLVHATLWDPYEDRSSPDSAAQSTAEGPAAGVVASAARRAAHADPTVEVSTATVSADPITALLQLSESASAVVVGTRGRGGISGMLLGSTSLEVAAHAKCPVVVVRGAVPNTRGDFSRVTVGVGGDGNSSAATDFAFHESRARGAELHALHAWHHPARDLPGVPHLSGDASDPERQRASRTLDDAVLTLAEKYPEVTLHKETPEGRARDFLLDASAASDLLVVGARRRRHGSVGMQLGAVNHAVLHHSACPVAVVPQES